MGSMAKVCGVSVLLALGAGAGNAQDKSNRYSLSPAEGGGYVRLDNQTGEMAICRLRNEQWVCQEMADRSGGLGDEIERLRKENRELKAEIRRLEDQSLASAERNGSPAPSNGAPSTGAPRADAPPPGLPPPERRADRSYPPPPGPPGKLPLPTEEDVDQAMTYIQRMLRKFREKMRDIERDANGTPL